MEAIEVAIEDGVETDDGVDALAPEGDFISGKPNILGSNPNILGSMPPKRSLGSISASIFGSMPARSLGSIPAKNLEGSKADADDVLGS